MSLVPEAHPAGSINAAQISSRPICFSLAAFLQLELFRYIFEYKTYFINRFLTMALCRWPWLLCDNAA
ncbi:hypothetical protein DVQ84_03335 [Yersinia enterocolitica]|nr:hypothetical protein [Yersinia enterocolitica]EKN6030296.1 hypothetical protein [Yersinia enterocolitica]EKN6068714.1 hypothetical protein [Yersinia enterocolitica]EKN6184229.1 hypothetical protein [Yersinia enterocolitica]EKN6189428.1 hypothetical protein [Yersinia enterocolitica]